MFTRNRDAPEDVKDMHPQGNGWKFFTDLLNIKSSRPNEHTASHFEDIYTCINILSDDVAKLPIKVYKRQDNKIERIKNEPISEVLENKTNSYMIPFTFKKLLMTDVLTNGNFYALIKFGDDGQIEELLPMSASTTTPIVNRDGSLVYQTTANGKIRNLLPYEVLHIKGYTLDGITGLSPIRVIADSVESNYTATQFNKEMMAKGGTPEGILKVPTQLNKDSRDTVRDEWKKANSAEAIAVIDNGLEYQQVGISQYDMQFIEAQKFNQQKIAAVFKVPMHKINNLERATYSNIEEQSLDYVKNTLTPWVVQIEEEINDKLFIRSEKEEGRYVKFNLASELRGDAQTQAKVEELDLRNGKKTINELRVQNEMSPFEADWADKPLITLNYTFADHLLDYQNARYGVNKVAEEGTDGEGSTNADGDG